MYLPNDTVLIQNIGKFEDTDPSDAGAALVCNTGNVNRNCCRQNDGGNVGEWHFPNGTIVPRNSNPGNSPFTRSGSAQQVRLNRKFDAMEPLGQYLCKVPGASHNISESITIALGV